MAHRLIVLVERQTLDDSLKCKLAIYTSLRHNSVRDSAQIIREVCWDVQIEPTLLRINQNRFERRIILLTMQVWIFLWEGSNIAVIKHSLTEGSHILPCSLILIKSLFTEIYWQHKQDINTTKESIDIWEVFFQSLVFATQAVG